MNRILIFGLFLLLMSENLKAQDRYTIIPYPNKLVAAEDNFDFKSKLYINFDALFKSEIEVLGKIFEKDYFTQLIPSQQGNVIVKNNESLKGNEYKLIIGRSEIRIEASTKTACFYAFQTLR